MPLIRIKCPNPQCGVEISMQFAPEVIYKDFNCPYCKQKAPFWKWIGWKWSAPEGWRWDGYPNPPVSHPPKSSPVPPTPNPVPLTPNPVRPTPNPVPPSRPSACARLVRLRTNEVYELVFLKQYIVVGRMAKTSKADIQIPDVTGTNRMSRSHLIIERKMEYGQYVYYASLYIDEKQPNKRINATFVNNIPLQKDGPPMMLYSGDIIDMPNEILRFEIIEKNAEETELAY